MTVFPYLSVNHDEGAYIFHARLLTQGKLWAEAPPFSEFYNAWLIVNDGTKIYPQYAPVFPAVLAMAQALFGDMHVGLALIAAGVVMAFYFLVRELYDSTVALLACIFLLFTPLFLVQASVFLSYMFSFLLNLLAFLFFIKAHRERGLAYAVLAGACAGLGAFARPYTALYFLLPIAGYGAYLLVRRRMSYTSTGLFIAGAAPFLALMLVYNMTLTGNPFLLPFNVFGPEDNLGFGPRRFGPWSNGPITVFTPPLAAAGVGYNMAHLLVWLFGGPFLVLLSFAYLVSKRLQVAEILLVSIFAAVVVGTGMYWGNLSPAMGGWPDVLLSNLGPRYYVDLLLPLCVLGAKGFVRNVTFLRELGTVSLARTFRGIAKPPPRLLTTMLAALAIGLPMLAINAFLLYRVLSDNHAYVPKNQAIYDPVNQTQLESALVFLPTPYGPFIHHPLVYLLNDPTFNGPVQYSRNLGNNNLPLIQSMTGRTPYYFQYVGTWNDEPAPIPKVRLVPLSFQKGEAIALDIEVTNPASKPYVVAYVWNDGRADTYVLDDGSTQDKDYRFRWNITSSGIQFEGPHIGHYGDVALSTATTINVAVAFSDSAERKTQDIFELRLWFDIQDDTIRIVAPGEAWENINWPTGRWLEQDVAPVLRISVRAQG